MSLLSKKRELLPNMFAIITLSVNLCLTLLRISLIGLYREHFMYYNYCMIVYQRNLRRVILRTGCLIIDDNYFSCIYDIIMDSKFNEIMF